MPDYQPHTIRRTAEYSAPTFRENSAPFDKVLDVAVDPLDMAFAIIAQQRDVTCTLLHHEHIAVGQHQKAARICQPCDVRGSDEAFGHLECLPAVGNDE